MGTCFFGGGYETPLLNSKKYSNNYLISKGYEVSDVTDEYKQNATPKEGKITRDDGYQEKEHEREIAFAEWLYNTYGGDIRLRKEPGDVKSADYLWNGKLWDLKTVSTEQAANSAIKDGHKQTKRNPGGVVLNYQRSNLSLTELESVIAERIKWYDDINLDVMIVNNWKVVKITRYKK